MTTEHMSPSGNAPSSLTLPPLTSTGQTTTAPMTLRSPESTSERRHRTVTYVPSTTSSPPTTSNRSSLKQISPYHSQESMVHLAPISPKASPRTNARRATTKDSSSSPRAGRAGRYASMTSPRGGTQPLVDDSHPNGVASKLGGVTPETNSVIFLPNSNTLTKKKVHLLRSKPFLHSDLKPGSYWSYEHAPANGSQSHGTKHQLPARRPQHSDNEEKSSSSANPMAAQLEARVAADEARRAEFNEIQHLHRQVSHAHLLQHILSSPTNGTQPKKSGNFNFNPISPRRASNANHPAANESALVSVRPTTLRFQSSGDSELLQVTNLQDYVVGYRASTEAKYTVSGMNGVPTEGYLYPNQTISLSVRADWSQVKEDESKTSETAPSRSPWSLYVGALSIIAQPLMKSNEGKIRPKAHQHSLVRLEKADTQPNENDLEMMNQLSTDETVSANLSSTTLIPISPPAVSPKPVTSPRPAIVSPRNTIVSPRAVAPATSTVAPSPRPKPSPSPKKSHHLPPTTSTTTTIPSTTATTTPITKQPTAAKSSSTPSAKSSRVAPPAVAPSLTPEAEQKWNELFGVFDPILSGYALKRSAYHAPYWTPLDAHDQALLKELKKPKSSSASAGTKSSSSKSPKSPTRSPKPSASSKSSSKVSVAEQRVASRINSLTHQATAVEYALCYRSRRIIYELNDPPYRPLPELDQPIIARCILGAYKSMPPTRFPGLRAAIEARSWMRLTTSDHLARFREESFYHLDGIERMVDQRLHEHEQWKQSGVSHGLTAGLTEEEQYMIPLC